MLTGASCVVEKTMSYSTSPSCGNGSACSAAVDVSRRSDPDHLDPGDGVVVVVLGDDRDLLGNRGGSH